MDEWTSEDDIARVIRRVIQVPLVGKFDNALAAVNYQQKMASTLLKIVVNPATYLSTFSPIPSPILLPLLPASGAPGDDPMDVVDDMDLTFSPLPSPLVLPLSSTSGVPVSVAHDSILMNLDPPSTVATPFFTLLAAIATTTTTTDTVPPPSQFINSIVNPSKLVPNAFWSSMLEGYFIQ